MKYLDVKGKQVLTSGGCVVGTICDAFLNPEKACICGFIVAINSMVRSYVYVPIENIKTGNNQLMVCGITGKIKRTYLKRNLEQSVQNYINKDVNDSMNRKTGQLVDLIFDEDSGLLQALIITKGFFEDVLEGRKIVLTEGCIDFRDGKTMLNESCCMNNEAFYNKYLRE